MSFMIELPNELDRLASYKVKREFQYRSLMSFIIQTKSELQNNIEEG